MTDAVEPVDPSASALDRHAVRVTSGPAFEATGLVHRLRRGRGRPPHPTIVMLHGREGDEDAMWALRMAIPGDWLAVAPRAPFDHAGGYDWRRPDGDEWPVIADFDGAVAAIHRLVTALPALYDADPAATYLMGFSQGAAAAFATAIAHPGLVRGIAAIVGFVPADCRSLQEVRPLADLPVFMAAGRRDPLIPLSRSRMCARTLRAIGADLEYHEYNAGHKLSSEGMRDLGSWWRQRPELAAGFPERTGARS